MTRNPPCLLCAALWLLPILAAATDATAETFTVNTAGDVNDGSHEKRDARKRRALRPQLRNPLSCEIKPVDPKTNPRQVEAQNQLGTGCVCFTGPGFLTADENANPNGFPQCDCLEDASADTLFVSGICRCTLEPELVTDEHPFCGCVEDPDPENNPLDLPTCQCSDDLDNNPFNLPPCECAEDPDNNPLNLPICGCTHFARNAQGGADALGRKLSACCAEPSDENPNHLPLCGCSEDPDITENQVLEACACDDDLDGDSLGLCCAVGTCSLREAIAAANATPGADEIRFDIPGRGPHVIEVDPVAALALDPAARQGNPLPPITDSLTIDGLSQPGSIETGAAHVPRVPSVGIEPETNMPVLSESLDFSEIPDVLPIEINGGRKTGCGSSWPRLTPEQCCYADPGDPSEGDMANSIVGCCEFNDHNDPDCIDGLEVAARDSVAVANVVIRGLSIVGFKHGIHIPAGHADCVTIEKNYLGVRADGLTGLGNVHTGATLDAKNLIARHNVSANNTNYGMAAIAGITEQGEFSGNIIGANRAGTPQPNESGSLNIRDIAGTTVSDNYVANGTGQQYGIRARNSRNSVFAGNTIENHETDCCGELGGIDMQNSRRNRVSKNLVRNNAGSGIDASGSVAPVIEQNIITGNGQDGITYGSPGGSPTTDSLTQNNEIAWNGDRNIEFWGNATNNRVIHNFLHDSRQSNLGCFPLPSFSIGEQRGLWIEGNRIARAGSENINLATTPFNEEFPFDSGNVDGFIDSVVIRDNQIEEAIKEGILVQVNVRNVEISGNEVRANGATGLVFRHHVENVIIDDNAVTDNGISGIAILQGTRDFEVTGSRISGNAVSGIYVGSSSPQIDVGLGNPVVRAADLTGPRNVQIEGNEITHNRVSVLVASDLDDAYRAFCKPLAQVQSDPPLPRETLTCSALDLSPDGAARGVRIVANSIAGNDSQGIDLTEASNLASAVGAVAAAPDSLTPNDAGDTDDGANGLQNFPLLTSASASAGRLEIRGTLDSPPGEYRYDFYASRTKGIPRARILRARGMPRPRWFSAT